MISGGFKDYFTIGLLMVIINGLTIYEVVVLGNVLIYEEGYFVEGISAFCYLFAAITTFFRSFNRNGLEQKLTWIFSLTCLLFFVRELDLEDLNIPYLLIWLGAGTGRNILFLAAYSGVLVALFSSSRERASLSFATLHRSPVIRISVLACVILVIARVFEVMHFSDFEEILEMNSSILILFAAIRNERVPLAGVAVTS